MERARLRKRRARPRKNDGGARLSVREQFEETHREDALYPTELPVWAVRLAAAHRLLSLYDNGKLPLVVMRALDRVRLSEPRRR